MYYYEYIRINCYIVIACPDVSLPSDSVQAANVRTYERKNERLREGKRSFAERLQSEKGIC
jgi:hypothetical protein